MLQPKFHYSCLKVILDQLEKLFKPDANALLHEFGFQLLYELCIDPLTCGPIMDLLSTKRYQFFIKAIHSFIIWVWPIPFFVDNERKNPRNPRIIYSFDKKLYRWQKADSSAAEKGQLPAAGCVQSPLILR
nr:nuclear pore complex protein NUP205 isoform X1 [Ipomoea batatas]